MMSGYLLWKLLHVLAAILFLGNITTGLFWAARAHRSRDLKQIESTFAGIIASDRLFTVPGVFGILIGGFAGAIKGQMPVLGTGWILWPIILFSMSGLIFGIWLAPLQKRIYDLARSSDSPDSDWRTYEGLYKKWEIWGAVALGLPAIAAAIMILKPSLPAF